MFRRKFENRIFSYFNEAIDLYEIKDDTQNYIISVPNIIKMNDIVFILSDMIYITDDKLNYELIRSIINEGIKVCKYKEILDFKGFMDILNDLYIKRLKSKKNSYKIVASFHMNPSKLPQKKGRFLDYKFSIYNSKTFFKKYNFRKYINPPFDKIKAGLNSFILLPDKDMYKISEPYYIELSINSINVNEAMYEGWRIIEIFRAIINFSLSLSEIKLFGGRDKPFSKLLPSNYIFLFDDDNNFLTYWYTLSLYERKNIDLNEKYIKKLNYYYKEISNILKKAKNNQLKEILLESFDRHVKGLDEVAYGTSIICFWQNLELISLKHNFNFSETEVCKRIKSLFSDETIKNKINVLYSRRNYLIHEGLISNYDLMDINNAKKISELLILFLMQYVNKFDNIYELNYFYKYRNENDAHIKRIKKILSFIEKSRDK